MAKNVGVEVLCTKANSREGKDFDDKAYSWFLVGYATQNTRYMVFVPALDRVVSLHVIFNDIILNLNADYVAELERLRLKIKVAEVQRGFIVAYRRRSPQGTASLVERPLQSM